MDAIDAADGQFELMLSIITSGPAGSLSYAFLHQNTTLRQKSVHVLIGSLAALFLGPAVVAYFGIRSLTGFRAVSFLFGLLGNIFLPSFVQYAEQVAPELVSTFLRKWLGLATYDQDKDKKPNAT